jgi:hypothetical protein
MAHGRFVASVFVFALALSAPSAPLHASGGRGELRPIVVSLVDELEDALGHRKAGAEHTQELVERLAEEFNVSGTRERATIVKALERCFSARQQGKPVVDLACLTARALASMAPESLPALSRALDNDTLLRERELARTLVLALGKTRDKAALKQLYGFLDHRDEALVAAAGAGLGEFEGADLATRKQAFEETLKALTQAKDQFDGQAAQTPDPSSPHDDAAQKRYDTIAAALSATLQRLSKQEAKTPDEWQRWWNRNKRADWDDKSKLG